MANNAKHPQINLLLTRPLSGSRAFWDALSIDLRQCVKPIFSPLIEILPLSPDLPELKDVIFSSVNGVKHSPDGVGQKAYCVGEVTTQSALKAGWEAQELGETSAQFVSAMIEKKPTNAAVHLAGVHTRGKIAQKLSKAGISTRHIAVYEQKRCNFNSQACAALTSNFPLLVPLFSPRTATSFAEQFEGCAPLHIVAISQEVADEVDQLGWETLDIAERPTRAAMIAAVQMVAAQRTLG